MPDRRGSDRLPRGLAPERLLRGQLGDWVARPWLDRAAFGNLGWYFPLSRLWAAASVADGDLDRFAAAVPLPTRPNGMLVVPALAGVREAVRRHRRIDAAWQELFFGTVGRSPAQLVRAELERRTAARIWMASRGLMAPVLAEDGIPPVRWAIPSGTAFHGRFAAALADPAVFFRPAESAPAIEQSRRVPGPDGLESWLRFPSPGLPTPDTAWAKVYEPEFATPDMPTLILCHGLAVETEMWGTTIGAPSKAVRAGLRVICPEAPWHGRRMLPGFWGGEPLIASAPAGGPDLLHAALGEIAAMIAWARDHGSRAVAVGGTSLGALTSQFVATQARHWPTAMRPDFLYLVTTSESMEQVAVDSELGEVFGLGAALARAGWTHEELEAMRVLTDPLGDAAMPAEHILMVLGTEDSVTRFDRGRALAERWRVPAQNLYIRKQGHFSAAVGAVHDDAPMRRLIALLDQAR